MRIGALRNQVNILQRATGRDAAGQPSITWTSLATVWANIKHPSGSQSIESDAQASVVKASIRIRWRTDVTAAMRVQHGAAVYEITAVLPELDKRQWVDLACQQVTNG